MDHQDRPDTQDLWESRAAMARPGKTVFQDSQASAEPRVKKVSRVPKAKEVPRGSGADRGLLVAVVTTPRTRSQ